MAVRHSPRASCTRCLWVCELPPQMLIDDMCDANPRRTPVAGSCVVSHSQTMNNKCSQSPFGGCEWNACPPAPLDSLEQGRRHGSGTNAGHLALDQDPAAPSKPIASSSFLRTKG
uniref:Uncharacterized protein n=1 Tax=Eutreptiella gymnastica TaxID=73025 RepID=A0A7S4GEZ7_9EUGL